jgi:hypothetical protein
MRSTVVFPVSMVFAGLMGVSTHATAQGQQPRGGEAVRMESAQTEKVATELEQAHTASRAGDITTAAQRMQGAAAELRREAGAASGEDKRLLERSARELEQVAEAASKGEGKMTAEIDQRVARVEHDLAEYHVAKARESWGRKAAEKTGHELRAAAHHVENGAKWAGIKVERGTRDVVGGAMQVSGKLVEGAGYVPKEVGRAIEGLGGEVDKLGKKVMPSR